MDKDRGTLNYNKIKKDKWKRNLQNFDNVFGSSILYPLIDNESTNNESTNNESNNEIKSDDQKSSQRGRSKTRLTTSESILPSREEEIEVPRKSNPNRKNIDYVSNPSNYRPKFRSESPPAKSHRTKNGINGGKVKACSFCRPTICRNMEKRSQVREEALYFNKKLTS